MNSHLQQSEKQMELLAVETAYDMKAIVILTACDIMQKLADIGDMQGAHALQIFVETIERIPTKEESNIL